MRYGVCIPPTKPEQVRFVKEAGLDYVEANFIDLARMDDDAFAAWEQALSENGLKMEAGYCLVPGELPLTVGYDPKALEAYLRAGLKRGYKLGLKRVSFGSGRARRLPDGMEYAEGVRCLIRALKDVIGPVCAEYGVTVCIEPLRANECNMINSLREGAMLAAAVNRDNVRLLADIYHMKPDETYDDIRFLKGVIRHGHISQPFSDRGIKREFPSDPDAVDYKGFVDALEYAGAGTCSVEAACIDFPAEIVTAGRLLKNL